MLQEQFEHQPSAYLENLIINSGIFVEFGHSDLENSMNVDVVSILIHPGFHKNEDNTTVHDLALLKLSNDLEFNDAIQPISLPSQNYSDHHILFSHDLIFAGYGHEEMDAEEAKTFAKTFKGDDSELLRTKHVNIMKKIEVYLTMSDCNEDLYQVDDEEKSLLFSSTFGMWHGDSGGPLMKISPTSNNHEVIGIARGAHLCSSGIVNTFTRISHYVPWIQENLEKIDENSTDDFELDMEMVFDSLIDFFDHNGIDFYDNDDITKEEVNDVKINFI